MFHEEYIYIGKDFKSSDIVRMCSTVYCDSPNSIRFDFCFVFFSKALVRETLDRDLLQPHEENV